MRRTPARSVSGIASIRWVRPVLATLPSDLARALDDLAQVLQRRQQLLDRGQLRRHPDRGRDHVVGALAEVDVVVGMHRPCAGARARPASRSPRWHSCCSRCPNRSGRCRSGNARRARRRPLPARPCGSRPRAPFGNRPRPALTSAAAALTRPSARMKPRGMGRPDTGKLSHRALGLRAPQRVGGDLQFAHAVVLDAEVSPILRHCASCSVGLRYAHGAYAPRSV